LLRDILPKNLPAIAAALACINPNTIVDLISRMEAAARTMQFAQERADKEDEGLMIERIALGNSPACSARRARRGCGPLTA
jgi:hypothetical protein